QVDWYNGGMEHTTLHLLYSRFWHKFLYDIGVVPHCEPYAKRTSHGMILGEGGEKMSKSRGNVINPNDVVEQYGADTMRLYIMFIGDFEKAAPWSSTAVKGCKRFVDKVWNMAENAAEGDEISSELESAIHKTIAKVSEDIENLKFNTAIAALMTLANTYNEKTFTKGDMKIFLTLLAPFAPHVCDESWEMMGYEGFASAQSWPTYDPEKIREETLEIAIQVKGKFKATVTVPSNATEEETIAAAAEVDKVKKLLEEGTVKKTIFVKGKLVNFIVV
ncbi:MAG: class I tRNA ligase family protein, partial [Oscillospiraceae bacterium]|nr:class I tRNA ligase family protein [Oscillospiraceae bacterium]